MFRGATHLPTAARLERDLTWLKESLGADSLQFFDHNFFDREEETGAVLEDCISDKGLVTLYHVGHFAESSL